MNLGEIANAVFPWRRWKSATQLREEIDEEVRFHLEQRADELEATGMGREEARQRARALFGDVARMKLDCLTIQMGERIMMQKIQWFVIGVLATGLVLLGVSYATALARQREMAQALHAEMRARDALAQHALELVRSRETEPDAAATTAGAAPAGSTRVPTDPGAASPTPTPVEVTALWLARFREKPDDAKHGGRVAFALVEELDPQEAVRVVTEIWAALSDAHKKQSLKAFAFEHGHEGTLAILHLGVTDDALEVQNWAIRYLQEYAFRNFGNDYGQYFAWHERWKDTPLDEALATNAREFVTGLHGRDVEDVMGELIHLDRLDFRAGENLDVDLAEIFRDAGVLLLIENWLASGNEDAIDQAYAWATVVEPDEAWLRAHILPRLRDPERADPGTIGDAIRALGGEHNAWVVPELLDYLERTVLGPEEQLSRAGTWSTATALAEIGDPAVIPHLIGLIRANPCYDTIYGLGYFGLGKLTGVSYDEAHDGPWWTEWWSANLARFPSDVRAIPIPDVSSER